MGDAAQRLESLQDVSRQRMSDESDVDLDVEAGRASCRVVGVARQRPHDVEQRLLGQADQGSPKQGAERERVAAVGEHARERDEVLDLLALVEPLSGLRRDRDAPALQGLLVAPQLAAGRGQEGDVARSAETILARRMVEDAVVPDQLGRTWRRRPPPRRRACARLTPCPSRPPRRRRAPRCRDQPRDRDGTGRAA